MIWYAPVGGALRSSLSALALAACSTAPAPGDDARADSLDASGRTWHHPDRVLFAITKNGVVPPHAPAGYQGEMPAFGGSLSDEEIWAALTMRFQLMDPAIDEGTKPGDRVEFEAGIFSGVLAVARIEHAGAAGREPRR